MRFLAILLGLGLSCSLHAAELVDDDGRKIRIAAEKPRVIALAPHLAELVFTLDAGDQLVGTVEWSNFPDAAKEVPRIGDAFRIDYERVLGLQPDLVLAWGGGTPKGVIARLRELGQTVAVLTPDTLESIGRHVEWLGMALGKQETAAEVAREFRDGIAQLRHRYEGSKAITVFYQISAQPLFTVNGEHVISEALRLCGGRNVFSDLDTLAPAVTLEAVLGRDPEAIVMGKSAAENGNVERWKQWPGLAAVKYHNLLGVDAEVLARATPRMLQGVRELCSSLEDARERIAE